MSNSLMVMSTVLTQAPIPAEVSPVNPPLPDVAFSSEKIKSLYREDVRAEFLHLQAEADCLLQQLQSLQQAKRKMAGSVVTAIGQTVSLS
ncbi:hypothetical protein OOK60_17000 [Trichothermofontia sichuanensis B231]|uniref:hypothetical protein n=1 Tax=Trichothermofontia sichuanensis TaxID=3045816 RepID=UPI002247DD7E|nr:hypothetical protein [Trichothermofontia sichuanensis]UZQ54160.1 hypothetical protein OOK60_17000 [Trichothermofontia sichuanensis B231]